MVGWTSHFELIIVSLNAWIALIISTTLVVEVGFRLGPPYSTFYESNQIER